MWRLKPGQSLALHDFPDGEESVLYNNLSGDTHLLGASAVDLLLLLQAGPADRAMLGAALGEAAQAASDPGFDAELAALLEQLASLHLIEAFPC